MRIVVATPPEPVVSLAEAGAHLHLGDDLEQDSFVESLIAAATGHIDGPDGWLGRAIGRQTLEARFSTLGVGCRVKLPYPPVISLVSVKYLDGAGQEQEADLADFELYGQDLEPVTSAWAWEGGSTRREAARVRYLAGYEIVPAPIRAAILLMVGDMYRFRETVAGGQMTKVEMSASVEALLSPFRVFR